MVPEALPTAEGDLAQTPFAHLLVYALDRRLTGELFLFESAELTHTICFDQGQPVKIRMGGDYARLGSLLVAEGLVLAEVVERAAVTGGLLGDVLVLAGYVDPEPLDRLVRLQFELRMQRFFELGEHVTYSYFDQSEVLKEWGGEPMQIDPLSLLWRGIRAHGEKSTLFESTLDRIRDVPLVLHPSCNLAGFEFEADARLVFDVLTLDACTLPELVLEEVTPDVVRKVVYALTISRQFDLGRGTAPLGVAAGKNRHLAKVQLRSHVHRAGAAFDVARDRSLRSLSATGSIIPRDESSFPPPIVTPNAEPEELGEKPHLTEAEQTPVAEDVEESTRRLVSDTMRSLPLDALLKLAREKVDEKEPTMALAVCEAGLSRLADAGEENGRQYREFLALHVWARSLESSADLKPLTVQLDGLIRQTDEVALPRYVRGLLRKRLGDSGGATSDFRRVLELEPEHELAQNELGAEARDVALRGAKGFLTRLFRR